MVIDLETEKRLLALARELEEINRKILEEREKKRKENLYLRKQFYDTKNEIKKILAEVTPLDAIRDPVGRETLRNVRNGGHFQLDIEADNLEKMLKRLPPEVLEDFMREKGITVSENETDAFYSRMIQEFQAEIDDRIDPFEYLERKEEFSTIISNKRLPNKIFVYFSDIRDCFVFGQFYAVIGLCRVLLELAFRDRFVKLGLGKKDKGSNIYDLESYRIFEVIRKVSAKLNDRTLKTEAEKLYGISSEILHGRDTKMQLKINQVLDFVRKTFKVIERLYE